ncbi:hypothetical protein [Saccharothrix sp. HUAS TT1]|uniref:hypothetical protein n=1 Tax=unclassified Saccharothrix TaxID=2593673 RepID=UPI00345BBCF3
MSSDVRPGPRRPRTHPAPTTTPPGPNPTATAGVVPAGATSFLEPTSEPAPQADSTVVPAVVEEMSAG